MTQGSPSPGELAHYGVKGMKWGVRKAVSDKLEARAKVKRAENRPNKEYTRNLRAQDRRTHGNGGVKRINRRLNQGLDLKTARKKEARFQKNRKRAVKVSIAAARTYRKRKEIAATLLLVGGVVAQHVAVRAETKRGQAAAAEAMGLPRYATEGPTYSKKNRKGVYNISSL
ncbi:hypothetical protein SEA_KARDASHIAN_8 [Streptomyces phage Kardashian]|nr:hypothetical protein SEA_KARDASHIAN_8 [Streptomyces phage Kardashian]